MCTVPTTTTTNTTTNTGYIPVIVENVRDGDELRTDVEVGGCWRGLQCCVHSQRRFLLQAIRSKVKELGADNVLCVLTTTR